MRRPRSDGGSHHTRCVNMQSLPNYAFPAAQATHNHSQNISYKSFNINKMCDASCLQAARSMPVLVSLAEIRKKCFYILISPLPKIFYIQENISHCESLPLRHGWTDRDAVYFTAHHHTLDVNRPRRGALSQPHGALTFYLGKPGVGWWGNRTSVQRVIVSLTASRGRIPLTPTPSLRPSRSRSILEASSPRTPANRRRTSLASLRQ